MKVGFAGTTSVPRAVALTMAAVRGAAAGGKGGCGVVAVAYADADRVASLAAGALVDVAARAGARGVLLDTADKAGPGLRGLVAPAALAKWVAEAHEGGLAGCPRGPVDFGRSRVRPRCGCRHRRRARRRV